MQRSSATLLCVLLLGGCVSAPQVDTASLPYYAYVPLRDGGVDDRRASFASVFCGVLQSGLEPGYAQRPCTDFLHLSGEQVTPTDNPRVDPEHRFRVIVVPGFLGDCLQSYTTPFEDARALLKAEGIESELLLVGGRSSSAVNAAMIADRLRDDDIRQGPPVVLIGYSKGIADIMEALPLLADDVDHIAAVVSIAGVVNGSPLADEQSRFMRGLFDRLPLSGCPRSKLDGDAIESLSYAHRQAWLAEHALDPTLRFFSVAAFASLEQMSRVNRATYQKLARIDARNDGQVIYRDALIPNSTLLAFAQADHLAVALPIGEEDGALAQYLVNRNDYPRAVLFKSLLIAVQKSVFGPAD